MKDKILLDRVYAIPLLASFNPEMKHAIRSSTSSSLFDTTTALLTSSALIYDKILLEDTLGTSLSWLYKKDNYRSLWEVFELFSFYDLDINLDDKLIVEDNIKAHFEEKDILEAAKEYYVEKGFEGDPRSVISYINEALLVCKSMKSDFLPIPQRIPIIKKIFTNTHQSLFETTRQNIVTAFLTFKAPAMDEIDLNKILKFRSDKTVINFRELIQNIHNRMREGNDIEKEVLRELNNIQDEIIRKLKPKRIVKYTQYASSLLPFPISLGVQAAFDFDEIRKLSQYQWFFSISELT
jgi:hypothetical protein